MASPKIIRLRGHEERVLEEIRVGLKSYFVLEKLSGAGQVFRVFDPQGGPQGDYRSLHILPRSKSTEQKIEIIRRLVSPGRSFPTVIDYFAEKDRVLVVFSWVWGESLDRLLRNIRAGRAPRFSVWETIKRIRPLGHAVCEYHRETNLVHGDIKPANIVVTDRPHRFVLIDFGSAWPVERSVQRDRGDGASAPYAAPELLQADDTADFRADIFSVSAIWFELLTHKIPYEGLGGSAGAIIKGNDNSISLEPSSRLSRDRDRLPAAIWKRIDRALEMGLAVEPSRRFTDRRAWLNEMDEIDQLLRARPALSNWNERVLGFVRRLFRK